MRPLEPDPAAVERLAAGADPALLAEAARVTAPSEQEVAALLGALRRERVPTRRAWPVWVGGALLAGGMAFAGLRAVEAPAPVAPASVAPVVSPVVAEVRTPPPVIEPAPAPAPDVVPANRVSPPRTALAEPPEAARVEAAPEPLIPPPPPAPAPEASKEPHIFAALLAREEAGEAPGRLLPDVQAFAATARSTHLRAEAELLALELQARGGRAPAELAERAHTWAGEHVEHPRVGTAWLIAGDAAMKARDCETAKDAWAEAATSAEREVAQRARSRKCR